jgi:hypothetical protein
VTSYAFSQQRWDRLCEKVEFLLRLHDPEAEVGGWREKLADYLSD